MKGSQLIIKIKIKIPSSQMVMSTSKLVKEKKNIQNNKAYQTI